MKRNLFPRRKSVAMLMCEAELSIQALFYADMFN